MLADFNVLRRQQPLHKIVGALLFVALLASITACGKKIEVFDATPSRLCRGESTTVSWHIKGDKGILSSEPPLKGTGPVSSKGSRSFSVNEHTKFKIQTRGDENKFLEQEVLVFDARGTKDFGEAARPSPDNPEIRVAIIRPRAEKWPDNLRVETVSSTFQRELTVIHEGREITLSDDGSPSEALQGTKVSGEWTIKTKLQPEEMGENPSSRPPTLLSITIHFFCKQGG